MTDQLIDEATMEAAEEQLLQEGHLPALRALHRAEPDLHCAVSIVATHALSGVEGVSAEAHDAAHRAVWRGVLLAVRAYRMAHYRLWCDTELGGALAGRAPTAEVPAPTDASGGKRENDHANQEDGGPDGGAVSR